EARLAVNHGVDFGDDLRHAVRLDRLHARGVQVAVLDAIPQRVVRVAAFRMDDLQQRQHCVDGDELDDRLVKPRLGPERIACPCDPAPQVELRRARLDELKLALAQPIGERARRLLGGPHAVDKSARHSKPGGGGGGGSQESSSGESSWHTSGVPHKPFWQLPFSYVTDYSETGRNAQSCSDP